MSLFRGYVSSEWLVSREARLVYALAATNCILLPLTVVCAMPVSEATLPAVIFALKLVLFLEAMGCATLWVAMLYFWFNFDGGVRYERILWPVFFILVQPSALIYYLLVYRRITSAHAKSAAA